MTMQNCAAVMRALGNRVVSSHPEPDDLYCMGRREFNKFIRPKELKLVSEIVVVKVPPLIDQATLMRHWDFC
jgi:hypothetical protein